MTSIPLARLLPAMVPRLDLPRALLRGRYMGRCRPNGANGNPYRRPTAPPTPCELGRPSVAALSRAWTARSASTRARPSSGTSSRATWPDRESPGRALSSGDLALDDETFQDDVEVLPEAPPPPRELRKTLSGLRLDQLAVDADGRNRCLLSCFKTKTGRNAPSNSKFIFGLPAWMRFLVRPEPGTALAYVDYEQQEFGIAAALSGDPNMMSAYRSRDPYMAFAIQAGAVPQNATRETHPHERDLFKRCALAVQYGMGPPGLAAALGVPEAEARGLLRRHHNSYPVFWKWIGGALDRAMLVGQLQSALGWSIHTCRGKQPANVLELPDAGERRGDPAACLLPVDRGRHFCLCTRT